MFFWKKGKDAVEAAAVHDPQEQRAAPGAGATDVHHFTQDSTTGVFIVQQNGNILQERVTIGSALQVPAVWCAVNFLSRLLAALPLKSYQKTEDGRVRVDGDPVEVLMGRAANDEMSGFEHRRIFWQAVFTAGRGVSFIERNGRGDPINLWPLAAPNLTIRRSGGRKSYIYADGGRKVSYAAAEVLDLCFMPGADGLSSYSPIYSHAAVIGLAQAVNRYGAKFFDNGGVPAFALEGPFSSGAGVQRASDDLSAAVQRIAQEGQNALPLPDGYKLIPLGIDPEKMQMNETKRFLVEEIARIYGMPPAFLQDLTHGTFTNTEQQDLHLAKHVAAPWCKAFEGEVNLKLYGRAALDRMAEHALDGLLRGDLATRVQAAAQRIASGQTTLNEERKIENRPPMPGGDALLVQGAMVPATQAGAAFDGGNQAGSEG